MTPLEIALLTFVLGFLAKMIWDTVSKRNGPGLNGGERSWNMAEHKAIHERLQAIEGEILRLRERQHELANTVSAVKGRVDLMRAKLGEGG